MKTELNSLHTTEKQLPFFCKEKEHNFASLTSGAGFPHFSLQYFWLFFLLWVSCWSKSFCYGDSTPCSLTCLYCLLPGWTTSSPALLFSVRPLRSADGSLWNKACCALSFIQRTGCLRGQLHFLGSFVHETP